MKRLFVMMMVMGMTVVTPVWGSDMKSSGTATVYSDEELNPKTESIKIDPPYVVVDDDVCKIEITSLEKKTESQAIQNPLTTYRVVYTATNKSNEYDLSVHLSGSGAYIGQYSVGFGLEGGQSVKAGKIAESSFMAYDNEQGSYHTEGFEHLNSVEDLLQFDTDLDLWQSYEETDGNTKAIVKVSTETVTADLSKIDPSSIKKEDETTNK